MLYRNDNAGNHVVDHGLGDHYVGAPLGVSTSQATSPCPPPGYPSHTQWNGQYCCIPQACVPKQTTGTLAASGPCGSSLRNCVMQGKYCYCSAGGVTSYCPGQCGDRSGGGGGGGYASEQGFMNF